MRMGEVPVLLSYNNRKDLVAASGSAVLKIHGRGGLEE
jgi:hypothetical protein